MQRLEPREFGRWTADGRPCGHYEFSLYYGLEFECACGRAHEFKPWMEILSELPLFRFVVACPNGRHLTVLKARWNREGAERNLESELGTRLNERRVSRTGIEFQAGLLEARTGRVWSLEETAAYIERQSSGLTDRDCR
jgi:hypothetical protein